MICIELCLFFLCFQLIVIVSQLEANTNFNHVLLIGDSVDRFIVLDWCEAVNGTIQYWAQEWHSNVYHT